MLLIDVPACLELSIMFVEYHISWAGKWCMVRMYTITKGGRNSNSSDFCRLLLTFANSLDPDQDRQNVGPDLNPNRLTL